MQLQARPKARRRRPDVTYDDQRVLESLGGLVGRSAGAPLLAAEVEHVDVGELERKRLRDPRATWAPSLMPLVCLLPSVGVWRFGLCHSVQTFASDGCRALVPIFNGSTLSRSLRFAMHHLPSEWVRQPLLYISEFPLNVQTMRKRI